MNGDQSVDRIVDVVGELQLLTHIIHKNYEILNNLPQIEGVTLIGNKTYEDLNLHSLTNSEIEELLK